MTSFTFRDQLAYEAEGAAAGLQGKKREDCPYDKELEPDRWNHGCEVAAGEAEVIRSGTVQFFGEHSIEPLFAMPVKEAIESGRWKPRYAKWESAS